jgi:hypothetical protein
VTIPEHLVRNASEDALSEVRRLGKLDGVNFHIDATRMSRSKDDE